MTGGVRRTGRTVASALVLALAVLAALVGVNPTFSVFAATVVNSGNSAGTATYFTCAAAATTDRTALFAYPLNEASGASTAGDISGNGANGAYQGKMTSQGIPPIACPRDAGGAYVLDGSSSYVATPNVYNNPRTFTLEVWFKTTTAGGMLMGFGDKRTGLSGQHDRKLYMTPSGQLVFGIYSPGTSDPTITSPKSYADGAWHLATATLSPSTGIRLYVDGGLVASNPAATNPEPYSGYWRIGYDKLTAWPDASSNFFFTGSMRAAAVYGVVLSADQVRSHYVAGT